MNKEILKISDDPIITSNGIIIIAPTLIRHAKSMDIIVNKEAVFHQLILPYIKYM
jgi:hypothetical protein